MENGRIRLNGSFIIDPETHKVIEMQSLTAPESMPAVPTGAEIISPAPAPGREPIDEESFRRGVDYGEWEEKSAAAAPAGLRDVDQGEWEQPPVGAEKIETGIEYKTSLSDKNELLLNGEPVISPNGEIVKVEGGGDITHEIKSLPGGKVLIENQVIVDPTTKRAISRIDFNSLGLSEDNLHYAHTGPNYLVPGEQIIYLDGKRIYSARLIPKINLDGGPLQIETLPDGKIKIEGNIIVDPKTNFATVIETPSSQPEAHNFERFDVSEKQVPGGVEQEVISHEVQTDLTGRENLNMAEVEKLFNKGKISDFDRLGLQNWSRVISGDLEKLKSMDPNSSDYRVLKNAIRKTVEMIENTHNKNRNLFTPELKKLLK